MATIMANISPRILSKAGRLFSNSLADIFVELFQNSRRAGAKRIEVNLRAVGNEETEITVADNGSGIDDFAALLCLGDSNWDSSTEAKEDPAGMGFFSLLHTGATVISNGQKAIVTTQAFEGKEQVDVISVPWQNGTTIRFNRKEAVKSVKDCVLRTAKYGSVDVVVDGEMAPREDFLKDALFIKETRGVRIGVFKAAAHSYYSDIWNFHGKTIREGGDMKGLASALPYKGKYSALDYMDLNVRIDVIEASSLHLKLPDRNGIVYDDQYHQIVKEARTAMFEYLATQPEHTASYVDYLEAREIGVPLPEATPYFKLFSADPADNTTDQPFVGVKEVVRIDEEMISTRFAIVGREHEKCAEWLLFTLDVAARTLVKDVPFVMLDDIPRFAGYSWYSKLPRIYPVYLAVNGEIHEDEFQADDAVKLDDTLSLGLQIRSAATVESIEWDIPFAGWYAEGNYPSIQLIITRPSPWLMKEAVEPFGLLDAAIYVGFQPGDDAECDSYDTQLEYFKREADSEITRILHGPMGLVQLKLDKLLSDLNYEHRSSLKDAGISKVVFVLGQDEHWTFSVETVVPSTSDQVGV